MSTPPPDYDRQYNFENWQTINPTAPLPAQHVEAELSAIENSINSTISRLNEIQEQNGEIKFSQQNLNLIGGIAESAAEIAAQNKCDEYFAENYDPNIVSSAEGFKNQAQASASAAAASAVAAESSKNDASAHAISASVNASSAASYAQNAENSSDACLAAVDFVGTVQQSVIQKENDINSTYSASLQLKNWVESQAYKFVHKREDLTSVAVNMMYNQGDVQNTAVGQFFPYTFFNDNSVVSVDPVQYGASKWKRAHKEDAEPVVNIMHRDMMGTLAMTWRLFHGGQWSEAGQGYGSPTFGNQWTPVLPCFYDADFSPGATSLLNLDITGVNNALDAALCPVKYAKELISNLAAPLVHTHAISDVAGLQDALDNVGSASEISDINGLQTALDGKAQLSGAAFTGKISGTSVSGDAGVNIGIGGTEAASTTPGDLWIATGGTSLYYRDATGTRRQVLTTSQIGVIDTSATNPALRVTQRGTGEAIRVEDSNNPDSTPFVVDNNGNVAIGASGTSGYKLYVVGSAYAQSFVSTSVSATGISTNNITLAGDPISLAIGNFIFSGQTCATVSQQGTASVVFSDPNTSSQYYSGGTDYNGNVIPEMIVSSTQISIHYDISGNAFVQTTGDTSYVPYGQTLGSFYTDGPGQVEVQSDGEGGLRYIYSNT